MLPVQQPGRERHPALHHWPEELAVQCVPQGGRGQCGDLFHHRDGEGQWPGPVSLSGIPF